MQILDSLEKQASPGTLIFFFLLNIHNSSRASKVPFIDYSVGVYVHVTTSILRVEKESPWQDSRARQGPQYGTSAAAVESVLQESMVCFMDSESLRGPSGGVFPGVSGQETKHAVPEKPHKFHGPPAGCEVKNDP